MTPGFIEKLDNEEEIRKEEYNKIRDIYDPYYYSTALMAL